MGSRGEKALHGRELSSNSPVDYHKNPPENQSSSPCEGNPRSFSFFFHVDIVHGRVWRPRNRQSAGACDFRVASPSIISASDRFEKKAEKGVKFKRADGCRIANERGGRMYECTHMHMTHREYQAIWTRAIWAKCCGVREHSPGGWVGGWVCYGAVVLPHLYATTSTSRYVFALFARRPRKLDIDVRQIRHDSQVLGATWQSENPLTDSSIKNLQRTYIHTLLFFLFFEKFLHSKHSCSSEKCIVFSN